MTIIQIIPSPGRDTSFKAFLKNSWKDYLFQNIATPIIFLVSFFFTNIGLYAIPACIGVLAFMNVITTYTLHTRWKLFQAIMQNQAALLRGK